VAEPQPVADRDADGPRAGAPRAAAPLPRGPGVARAYLLLLRSRVAAQASYRRSFALDLLGQAATIVIELVEVLAIFHQVPVLAGFAVDEVLVIFGLGVTAFALADLLVGQIDRLGDHIRRGTLEIFLVRPLSVLGQLVTADLQLRRLGRLGLAIVVLAVALHRAGIDWTPARVTLAVLTVACGAVIFSALWVAASTVTVWLVEGAEFVNAVTYGGSYMSQWPFSVFHVAVARFFTFVLPTGFVAYLPAVAILGRTEPTGLPGWLAWGTPVAAAWAVLLAAVTWRAGLRHYVGAGG
jgi:ABC-2 type transport system permease protein